MRKYLKDEEVFLANYSDGLSDLPLDELIASSSGKNAVASFVSFSSPQSFHTVQADEDGIVTAISAMNKGDLWINGGFFVPAPGDLRLHQ